MDGSVLLRQRTHPSFGGGGNGGEGIRVREVMDSDRDFIELNPDDEYEAFEYRPNRIQPWKAKLIFWSVLTGGVAVGTLLFLTFLSLFIYFFIPIVLGLAIWYLIRNMIRRV